MEVCGTRSHKVAVVIGREKIVLKGSRINAGEVFFFTSISDNMCVGFFVFVFLKKKKRKRDGQLQPLP